MLQATQLRNNTCFLYQNEPYRVLEYKHTHLSRQGANIKIKAKNLKTGNIKAFNFGSADRFEEAEIKKKKMQFLYQDKDGFHFMDPQSFNQIEMGRDLVGTRGKFLKEGENIDILFWQDEALDFDLPLSIIVEITKTAPGVKGNSATNVFKPAKTDSGLQVKVPLFIKVGDKVKVDTRSGEYLGRA